jgi:hypothetical protein
MLHHQVSKSILSWTGVILQQASTQVIFLQHLEDSHFKAISDMTRTTAAALARLCGLLVIASSSAGGHLTQRRVNPGHASRQALASMADDC